MNDDEIQIIKISNLSYRIPDSNKNLFEIKNFEIKKNDKILLKGPSGKGKTTLLHIMAGFIKSYSGEVQFFGSNLSTISENELSEKRKKKSAFIFQKLNLITTLTPLENLELVSPKNFDKKEALKLLNEVGLENKANVVTEKLSTGEQQRVACVRAIFSRPEIIFADEPTSSLDDLNAEKVIKLLLQTNPSITLIIVSHDYRVEKYFSKIIQFEEMVKL